MGDSTGPALELKSIASALQPIHDTLDMVVEVALQL